MSRMLKADFYRILKSKLTLAVLIIAAAFPLLTVGLYALLNLAFSFMVEPEMEPVSMFQAGTLIQNAFTLTQNVGLVIPVFSGIMVCMDISNGTLRNKVITGNSRAVIYGSHLITSAVFNLAAILIYVCMTAVFGMLLLPFTAPGGKEAMTQVLYWAVTGFTAYVYAATISTFFALVTKKTALTIVFTLVAVIFVSSVGSLLTFLQNEDYKTLIYLFPTATMSQFSFTFSNELEELGFSLVNHGTIEAFLLGLASFGLFGTLNTVVGMLIFRKQDLK